MQNHGLWAFFRGFEPLFYRGPGKVQAFTYGWSPGSVQFRFASPPFGVTMAGTVKAVTDSLRLRATSLPLGRGHDEPNQEMEGS